MSTLTIQMSESLARQLREYAAKEGLTVDQLLSSAAAEKLVNRRVTPARSGASVRAAKAS